MLNISACVSLIDAANDVYSSLLVHLHLKRLAPEGVDVEAFATEFGHAPTNAEGSTTPTNAAPRPRPTPAGPPGVTPRQLEAYRLLHDERLPLAAATKQSESDLFGPAAPSPRADSVFPVLQCAPRDRSSH